MENLDLATPIRRNPDMVAADMDGDLVMMSIERGEYFGVSGSGTRLWELLDEPRSVSEVCERICAEYDVDAETCRQDMLAFAQELLALDLVVRA